MQKQNTYASLGYSLFCQKMCAYVRWKVNTLLDNSNRFWAERFLCLELTNNARRYWKKDVERPRKLYTISRTKLSVPQMESIYLFYVQIQKVWINFVEFGLKGADKNPIDIRGVGTRKHVHDIIATLRIQLRFNLQDCHINITKQNIQNLIFSING